MKTLTDINDTSRLIVGDWYRPVRDLVMLAAVGVDFVIGWEDEGGVVSRDAYKAACRAAGLRYLLQIPPDDATLVAEAADDWCLGWDQPDEPNDNPNLGTAALLRSNFERCQAAAPHKTVLLNVDGWQQWSDFDYKSAAMCCTWLMFDYYVKNRDGRLADVDAELTPIVARFKQYTRPGSRLGYFIETSDQLLTMQSWDKAGVGPTPADIMEYFALAVRLQCTVVGLFSDVIGTGFISFDGTTVEGYAAIRAAISQYSSLAVSTTAPPTPPQAPAAPVPTVNDVDRLAVQAAALTTALALQTSRVDALYVTEKQVLATLQKCVNNVAYMWKQLKVK